MILAILSTLIEAAAIVAVVLLGLPQLGINIPLPGLVALMMVWGVFSVVTYRMGTRALMREPVAGMADMTGSKGKVISALAPRGVIKIGVEFWGATSAGRRIKVGEKVTVVGREGLMLIVSKSGGTGSKKT